MDNDMTRGRNAGSQPQGKQIRSAQWQLTDRTLVSVPNLNAAIRLLVSHGLFPVGSAIPPEELQARLFGGRDVAPIYALVTRHDGLLPLFLKFSM